MRKIRDIFYILPIPFQRYCHQIKNLMTVIKGGLSPEIDRITALYLTEYNGDNYNILKKRYYPMLYRGIG